MKYTLTFLLGFIALTIYAQTIDLNLLPGTWLCYKATQSDKKDVTEYYKGCNSTFKTDSTYLEEMGPNSTTKGAYILNKKNKTLTFKNLILTTKYPDGKVKINDLVMPIELQEKIIILLDKDNLVILLKKNPNSELQADTRVYYKRQK